MIARITRLLLVAQIVFAYGLYRLLLANEIIGNAWLAAGLALAIIVLLRLLITASNFAASRYYGSATPPLHRLIPWQACRLFFNEFAASMTVSSWSMPFCAFAHCAASAAPVTAFLPVLLVHGYACNSGYWSRMHVALRAAGVAHRAIDLEPMNVSIDAYGAQLAGAIEALCRETGQDRVIIVAHSMGGLATRAYLRAHGAAKVAAAITLGTPHHGSALAKFAPGLNCREMRWTGKGNQGQASSWLTALEQQETAALRARFVSIYSHHDNIVAPQTSSHFADAKNIAFHGIGHVALARHPRIIAQVMEEVRRISGARASGKARLHRKGQ